MNGEDPLNALGRFLMKSEGLGKRAKRGGSELLDLVRGAEIQGPRMHGGEGLGRRSPLMQPGDRFGGLFGDAGLWSHAKETADELRDGYGMNDVKFRGPSALEKFLAATKAHPGRTAAAAATGAGALAAYRGLSDGDHQDDDLDAEYRRRMQRDQDPEGILLNHRW